MAVRYITTFNRKIYDATGKNLLESFVKTGQADNVLVYGEGLSDIPCGELIDITKCPELAYVRQNFHDIIGSEYGGGATNLTGFNQRWFGWFHKIVAQYDALTRRPTDDYTIFLDSDVRCIRPLTEDDLKSIAGPVVSIMNGERVAVETGVIVYAPDHEKVRWFINSYMDLYLSGEFQHSMDRWDDSNGMTFTWNRFPGLVKDLAGGLTSVQHQNSNGHTTGGQVLPITPLGEFFEHDKGIHWRMGIEECPGNPAAQPQPKQDMVAPKPKRLFSRVVETLRGRS